MFRFVKNISEALNYAFGNNTYLCEKAARAINHLRGAKVFA